MLKLEKVETTYGHIRALKGISIEVNKGEIVTLIGANGAGKTTTLSTIIGIIRPKSGKIFFNGKDITRTPSAKIVASGIALSPEGRRVFPKLTVMENLEMGAYSLRDQSTFSENLEKMFGLFPVLKERQKQMAGTLSGGEQQMLSIARAMMANPTLLLLDEPSLGLAPMLVKSIFATIDEINKKGVTVLLVEQNAKAALSLAHRGYVLETGNVILEGTGKELLDNELVKKAYLGG
ncbi:MAG: ABC transporter ATP-binding protein [Spirochaetes bacterium]|nr:MAG: ABC transporter ATP-binding protein [Spirochaetota bacterium]